MDEITAYAGRDLRVVKDAISSKGFPAIKVHGRWESNTQLVDDWQRRNVQREVESRLERVQI